MAPDAGIGDAVGDRDLETEGQKKTKKQNRKSSYKQISENGSLDEKQGFSKDNKGQIL